MQTNGEQMGDTGRNDIVTYREHVAAIDQTNKRVAAVELEQATMKAALLHVPDDLRQLTNAVNALASKMQTPAAPANDGLALALHHAADAFKRASEEKPAAPAPAPAAPAWTTPALLPWILFFGLLGAVLGDAGGLLSLVGG